MSSARSDLKTFTFPLAPYNFRMTAICDESNMRTLLRLMLMPTRERHQAAAALLAPGVHEYSPKRTIFDQIADCFSSLRQRKDPADRRLQLTFLQEFQESFVRCSHRLLGEESEGEPADRCSLPDDVGNVDLGLTSSSIAGSDHSATEGERCERLASQFSADAVDDDID